MEETALRRGRHDIALASVLSDAGLRISEAADLRWRDVFDAEDGAGLVYIERSKTDQAGEGAYVVVTPDTLAALKQLREDSGSWANDDSVFGLSMSQISRRVDSMARAAGLGEGYSGFGTRGPGNQDDAPRSSAAGGADTRTLEVAIDAREIHQEREGARGAGMACLREESPVRTSRTCACSTSRIRPARFAIRRLAYPKPPLTVAAALPSGLGAALMTEFTSSASRYSGMRRRATACVVITEILMRWS